MRRTIESWRPGRRRSRHVAAAALLAAGATGCGGEVAPDLEAARAVIETAGLEAGIRDLSADSMGVRAPSSPGEERAVRYIRDRFAALGLEPGTEDGWFQEVGLVSIEADLDMGAEVRGRSGVVRLAHGTDFVAVTEKVTPAAGLDASALVFAGYGIVAPEFGWDDYVGLDVEGKTVVVLVNDPGYATEDPALFDGRAMTYYGRWTYKYEEAGRQGAAGVMIVHDAGPASYPWGVVETGWSGPQFLPDLDDPPPAPDVEGWFSLETARGLFERAGLDFDSLAAAAARPGFRAVPLGLDLTLELRNEIRRSSSRNVVARLPGRTRPDEHLLFLAHWDHLGTDPSLEGDSIFNGALDNASGVTGMLEIAEAFASLDPPPERSVLFVAVTAEEQGLLGSRHYAEHPAVPLERTVAAINLDALNIWGPTRDLTVVGYGNSELDSLLALTAADFDRVLAPDPSPEKGSFFRSDHFELAKRGVPALYAGAGLENLEHGPEWARARRDAFTAERYHQPSDEYDGSWNLDGAVADLRLLFTFAARLAESDEWPEWREGTPFRAVRERMRAGEDAAGS